MEVLIASDKKQVASTGDLYSAVISFIEKKGCSAVKYEFGGGGEGFTEDFTRLIGGDMLLCRVTDPNFFIKNVRYGVKNDIAVIGTAECCGLKKTMIKNPLYTTSYGLGEVIDLAQKLNKREVFVGLGDSALGDCGAGAICALGGKFFNKDGEEFTPVGNTLSEIESVDFSEFYKKIEGIKFNVLTDSDCRLKGKNGCAERTAARKGAKGEDAAILEQNICDFAEKTAFASVDDFDGAGASGGLGYSMKAFFGAEIYGCKEYMLSYENFEKAVKNSDAVIALGEAAFCEKAEKIAKKFQKKFIAVDGTASVRDSVGILEKAL